MISKGFIKVAKTTEERNAIKVAKSAFKQDLKNEYGPNYKTRYNQNVTKHVLTH